MLGCSDAVLDGLTGTLVAAHDPTALAKGLHGYVVSPDLRDRHGAAAREWICRDFLAQAMRAAIYQEYTRSLAEQGLGRLVQDTQASAERDGPQSTELDQQVARPNGFEPSAGAS